MTTLYEKDENNDDEIQKESKKIGNLESVVTPIGLTLRQKLHRWSKVFLCIYLFFPMFIQSCYGLLNSLLFWTTIGTEPEYWWFHVLFASGFNIGQIVILVMVICLLIFIIKKVYFRISFIVVYVYASFNIFTVAYGVYVVIRSPIVDRMPNIGEFGLFVITSIIGFAAFTGYFISAFYYFTRPNERKNDLC